jgi:hypothetical protein
MNLTLNVLGVSTSAATNGTARWMQQWQWNRHRINQRRQQLLRRKATVGGIWTTRDAWRSARARESTEEHGVGVEYPLGLLFLQTDCSGFDYMQGWSSLGASRWGGY